MSLIQSAHRISMAPTHAEVGGHLELQHADTAWRLLKRLVRTESPSLGTFPWFGVDGDALNTLFHQCGGKSVNHTLV